MYFTDFLVDLKITNTCLSYQTENLSIQNLVDQWWYFVKVRGDLTGTLMDELNDIIDEAEEDLIVYIVIIVVVVVVSIFILIL